MSGCTHTSISLSSLVLITSPTLPFKVKTVCQKLFTDVTDIQVCLHNSEECL